MIGLLIVACLTLTFGIGWLVGYQAAELDHQTHPSRRKKGTPR